MTSAASTSTSTTSGTELRLAELIAALSLGVDLGFDQPMEHVLRQTVIALRLADRLGLPAEQRSTLYYPRCWSTSGATWTPTSRRSGSATTSRSRRPSTGTTPAACVAPWQGFG